MRAITRYLHERGFSCAEDAVYSQIALWQRWYQGKVPAVHSYYQYNGRRKLRRTRKSLGMAKSIAEDWANLALNEKVGITVGKKTAEKKIWAVLDENQFRVRGNQLLEETFALGTGAFVERLEGDRVKLDYIRAGMIYPLAWDNGRVLECAFASERTVRGEKQVYLSIHRMERGFYVIENHLFRRDGDLLTGLDLPEDLAAEVRTGSGRPRFQIIKPNIANNLDPDCPLGLSLYALVGLVQTVAELLGLPSDLEPEISFDDSIIEDVGAEKLRFLQEIRDGVRQKWEYRVRFLGEDETTAKAMVETEQGEDGWRGFGTNGHAPEGG